MVFLSQYYLHFVTFKKNTRVIALWLDRFVLLSNNKFKHAYMNPNPYRISLILFSV